MAIEQFCAFVGFGLTVALFALFIRTIIEAFKTSFLWGLAVLFIPFAVLAFFLFNWRAQWQLFVGILICAGLVGACAGVVVGNVDPDQLKSLLKELRVSQ